MDELRPLSTETLQSALSHFRTGVFGAPLIYQPQVGSTNDLLRDLAAQGAPEGAVVIADEQTAGRGRMGRQWIAPPNTSLMFSTLFRPTLPVELALKVVMVCGLAIAEACEEMAPVKVDVKWPNDLQIGEKKLAGILPESSLIGERLDWMVIGMGINVNQTFDAADPLSETATSLRLASGKSIDRGRLFALIVRNTHRRYIQVADASLLAAWRQRCITLGQHLRVDTPQGAVMGVAQDIGSNGALHLRDGAGNLHFIYASEATVLRD